MNIIIERLSELLKEKKIQQKDLANKIGVLPSTISDWKSGRLNPSFEDIKSLAQYFDISTDYLLGLTNEKIVKINRVILWGVEFQKNFLDILTVLDDSNIGIGLDEVSRICEINLKHLKEWMYSDYDAWSVKPTKYQLECIIELCKRYRVCGNLDDFYYTYDRMIEKSLPIEIIRNKSEMDLLNWFRLLNNDGQEKILDSLDDLIKSDKYKKSNSVGLDKKEA